MLGFVSRDGRTCSGPTRREFLRIGGISAFGVNLAGWLAQREAGAATSQPPKDVNCILLWMLGGPSHVETYDMKPDAPVEVRGEFKPIATNRPGYQVCELMPKLAQCTEKFSVIRSMTSPLPNHPPGHYYLNSGRKKLPGFTPAGYGAMLMQQQGAPRDVPGFVQLGKTYRPDVGKGGYLGRQYDPVLIDQDPNSGPIDAGEYALPDFVDADRLHGRRRLLSAFDEYQRAVDRRADATSTHDKFQERAFSIISSTKTRRAFDLSREPDSLRDTYGRNRVGQRLLLARRLIESGVRFVRVQGYMAGGYDTHFKHFSRMKKELPAYDQAYSALLHDLEQRGMLENTLVITMGEFGRTPMINQKRGGRDHWSKCFSLTLGGGGLKRDLVIGESDRIGAYPASRRLTVPDLAQTIYHALGLDPHAIVHTSDGRPIVAMPEGEVIEELV